MHPPTYEFRMNFAGSNQHGLWYTALTFFKKIFLKILDPCIFIPVPTLTMFTLQYYPKSTKIGRRGLFGGTWRALEGQIGGPSALEVQVWRANRRSKALEVQLKSPLGAPLDHFEGTSRAFWGHLECSWRAVGAPLGMSSGNFGVQGALGVQIGRESADLEHTL